MIIFVSSCETVTIVDASFSLMASSAKQIHKATLCRASHSLRFLVLEIKNDSWSSVWACQGAIMGLVVPADVIFGLHKVFINFLMKCIQVKQVLSNMP